MHHAVHAGKLAVLRGHDARGNVRVVHRRARPHVVRRKLHGEEVAIRVRKNHALGERLEGRSIRRRCDLRDAQNRAEHFLPALVTIAVARVVTAVHHFHRRTAREERLEGIRDPAEDIGLRGIGDGPRRAGEQLHHRTHRIEQLHAVARVVGELVVKHERAVTIKTVAARHVREHIAQARARQRDLVRVLHQHAAHGHDERLPDFVRRREVRGDVALARRGREMVHRRHVVADLRGRKIRVEQRGDVVQHERRGDLEVEPVVEDDRGRVVVIGEHPIEAADGRGAQAGVAFERGVFDRVGERHRPQAGVGAADVARIGGGIRIRVPEIRARRTGVHRAPVGLRAVAHGADPVLIQRIRETGVRPLREQIAPAQAQRVELASAQGEGRRQNEECRKKKSKTDGPRATRQAAFCILHSAFCLHRAFQFSTVVVGALVWARSTSRPMARSTRARATR